MIRTIACLVFLAAWLGWSQPPPPAQRDLKIEKDVTPPVTAPAAKPAAVVIPRSYALVIGISKYQNLTQGQQLQYAERDAEDIYSILISPEGGNFRAENVHTLIGPKATLANIRRELEEWLPAAAKEDDRVLVYFAGHGFRRAGPGRTWRPTTSWSTRLRRRPIRWRRWARSSARSRPSGRCC